MPKFNRQRAALILAESRVTGVKATAEKFEISTKTLERYESRARLDSDLSALAQDNLERLKDSWADDMAPALSSGINFLKRAAESADPADVESIKAIASTVKILAELIVVKNVIDDRT